MKRRILKVIALIIAITLMIGVGITANSPSFPKGKKRLTNWSKNV